METVLLNERINYSVPISESLKENGNFIVRGVAINSTITRNGVKYEAFELEKATPSLRNKPILKDHEALIDNIVGRTTENIHFNNEKGFVPFEAVIKDKVIAEKISNGLITNVSIGAMVEDVEVEEQDDGSEILVARGIEFLELSLVAVPGDPGAGFTQALSEKFNEKNKGKKHIKKEKKTMDDNKKELVKQEKLLSEKNEEISKLKETLIISEKKLDESSKSLEESKEAIKNALVEKYKNLCEGLKVEGKETENLTEENLNVLVSVLEKVHEAKVKEDAEKSDNDLADEEKEAAEKEEAEKLAKEKEVAEEKLKMKGKINKEGTANNENELVLENFQEGSIAGYSYSMSAESMKEAGLKRLGR